MSDRFSLSWLEKKTGLPSLIKPSDVSQPVFIAISDFVMP